MSEVDHDRLSGIFLEACELEPEERSAFLERACGDDVELRAEVESLLVHDERVPGILEAGVVAAAALAEMEAAPRTIGRYHVLQKVGEGGMGIVYRAEQRRPLRRTVAIKLIKLGIETAEVIARFESERQALALMNHPNIARVLDAGATKQGRPYFVMEFVDGRPINEYCDRRRLGIRERLELFVEVCDGVQHAHQKGIIHRDIKPSNILVQIDGGRPVPKIIDFGVAKALDRRLAEHSPSTQLGQLVGTPEYMSPEQAEMTGENVDTRTDVYSLGLVLYELLAGVQPFEPAGPEPIGLDEVRRRIREEEPPRPSTRPGVAADAVELAARRSTDPRALVRRLRVDLDVITMKALEKEASRRYHSPAELAADIRRHLEDEPILASDPGRVYRLRKFVRKHRTGVAFTATLFLVLSGFAATMTVQTARVAHERDRAGLEAETTEEVLDFVVGLFELSNPSETRGSSITAREILDGSVEKIEERLAGQPLIQARMMATTGRVYRNLGLFDEARALLEPAHERLLALLGPDHPETLRTANSLAFLYFYRGLFDLAEPLYRDALERQRIRLGPYHRDTLGTMKNLANLYTATRRYEKAEQLNLETLEAMRSTLGELAPMTLRAMNELGILYTMWGRLGEAERHSAEALATQRRLLGDEHPATLSSMNSLAVVYMSQQRYEDAERLFVEAREGKRRVLGASHPSTLKTLYNQACLSALRERPDESIARLREVVDLGYESRAILDDPDLLSLRDDPRFAAIVDDVRARLDVP